VREALAPPGSDVLPATRPPTYSVIIAAYQAAAFIGDAVESALAQTLSPHEIIVCDDGSTDALDAALAPYLDRITLIHKENGGEASAKNAAAQAASGDFVAILDADDVYYPERLEALAELSMCRPDLDVVTTNCYVVADGRIVRKCYDRGYRFEVEDQRRGILERNFVGPGHMAVRRQALLDVGGFDIAFRHATDWDCWLRMIFSGSRVGMVDKPLAEYRIRESSLASDRGRQFEGYTAVLEHALRRLSLSARERATLERSLASQRRRLALHELYEALLEETPAARRLAALIACEHGYPARTRLTAALAAAFPRSAGKRLARSRRELAAGLRRASAR
jgi:glycosyltransferase involved in cell wall biosynthesis